MLSFETTDGPRRYPADFNGHWTLLFYYAGDFLPVSATELWGLAELQSKLSYNRCRILCISRDSVAVHLAFLENLGRHRQAPITFPLGTGDLQEALQLDPDQKYIWLLDPCGRSRAHFSYPLEVGANFTEVLRTLLALQTGKTTPCNWVPGEWALALPPTAHRELAYYMPAQEREGKLCVDWYLCYEPYDDQKGL